MKGFNCAGELLTGRSLLKLIAKLLRTSSTQIISPFFSIVQYCKELIAGSWDCTIIHINREANRMADCLAMLGHSLDLAMLGHSLDLGISILSKSLFLYLNCLGE
ncbi:hypothetical protein ACOSP7_025818 [Xanthoceras sorbifolium]